MGDYTKKQVAELVGIEALMVGFYTDQRVVRPEKPGKGRGHHHKYSDKNIRQFRLVKELASSAGLKLSQIKGVMRYLDREPIKCFEDPDLLKNQKFYLLIGQLEGVRPVWTNIMMGDAPEGKAVVTVGDMDMLPNILTIDLGQVLLGED